MDTCSPLTTGDLIRRSMERLASFASHSGPRKQLCHKTSLSSTRSVPKAMKESAKDSGRHGWPNRQNAWDLQPLSTGVNRIASSSSFQFGASSLRNELRILADVV